MARPLGSKNKFSVADFSSAKDAKEFLAYVKKNYQKSDRLAIWYGDHLYGKAPQPLSGDPDNPIPILAVRFIDAKGNGYTE